MRPDRPNGGVEQRSRSGRRRRLGALTVALLTAATLGAGCSYPPEDADPTGPASGSPETSSDEPTGAPSSQTPSPSADAAGTGEEPSASDGAAVESVSPSGTPQNPWKRASLVEPSMGMSNEQLIDWEDYRPVLEEGEAPAQATELEFLLVSGNANCFGVRAEVEEDGQTVRVATIRGVLQDTLTACTAEGRMVSLAVALDEPLGDREVVPMEEESVGLAD